MASLRLLVGVYLIGGLTFLPLLLAALFLHAYLTFPRSKQTATTPHLDALADIDDESLREKLSQSSPHEPEVAAGYFAVCREYVPGGVNGKPPERTTPAGETIATESPSVYQSIYRSVFERNKTQAPTFEAGKNVKKARNVFYVVLRHGHLILFDTSDQLEVRHVIALAHYDVDLYAGGEHIPEGELFIKRNCIRLNQNAAPSADASPARPFYLFSENCCAKEDMYFSILHNQERYAATSKPPPAPQTFVGEDMIGLIRQLHLSNESPHNRWINAILGRIFLGVYKTSTLEDIIRSKITKKISRVPKPAFITSLRLGGIDLGHSAPIFSNMRLKECTVDGDVTIEADIKYTGQLRLEIGAVARIELGSRLKPREVEMLLAGTVRLVDGHMLFRIKPPPSNRIWFSFETMPKLEMTIEPIVSSRQITYSVILRAIESRIREVLAETLVQPFWDDVPFFNTEGADLRGGIWKEDEPLERRPAAERRNSAPAEGIEETPCPEHDAADASTTSVSLPTFFDDDASPQRANSMPLSAEDHRAATLESKVPSAPAEKPKALRANSFAPAASPIISAGPAKLTTPQSQIRRRQRDAATAMKSLSSYSSETPPTFPSTDPPTPTPESPSTKMRSNSLEEAISPTHKTHRRASSIPSPGLSLGSRLFDNSKAPPIPSIDFNTSAHSSALTAALRASDPGELSEISSTEKKSTTKTREVIAAERAEQRKAALNQTLQTIGTATAAARNWGIGVMQRQMDARKQSASSALQLSGSKVHNEPMGRGQPLPPPGQPLPRPAKDTWSSMALGSLRRRPVPGTSQQSLQRQSETPKTDTPTSSLSSASEQSLKGIPGQASINSHTAENIETALDNLATEEPSPTEIVTDLFTEPFTSDEDEGKPDLSSNARLNGSKQHANDDTRLKDTTIHSHPAPARPVSSSKEYKE